MLLEFLKRFLSAESRSYNVKFPDMADKWTAALRKPKAWAYKEMIWRKPKAWAYKEIIWRKPKAWAYKEIIWRKPKNLGLSKQTSVTGPIFGPYKEKSEISP